jgi:hypothetical protein
MKTLIPAALAATASTLLVLSVSYVECGANAICDDVQIVRLCRIPVPKPADCGDLEPEQPSIQLTAAAAVPPVFTGTIAAKLQDATAAFIGTRDGAAADPLTTSRDI